MAESSWVKTIGDGTITIKDGAALSYDIDIEPGSFVVNQPKPESTTIMDRHSIAGQREGAQQIGTGSFSVHMRQFTDGTQTTIVDVIEKTGAWAGATSTGGTGYEAWMVDIWYTAEGTDLGDSADHVVKCLKCKCNWDFAEGDPNTINVNFEFWGGMTRTGPA